MYFILSEFDENTLKGLNKKPDDILISGKIRQLTSTLKIVIMVKLHRM